MPSELNSLQPAPHFEGRSNLLSELCGWVSSRDDPVRVVGLVAAGGTGKTALIERVVSSFDKFRDAGTFIWSFYEDPQTDSFLRSACDYFRLTHRDGGGLLEHLQRGLGSDGPAHLFVLDGLEVMQASGVGGEIRGALEDPLLKRFLRWLASGRGTNAKALVTTRFPLVDLKDWEKNRGYRAIELGDLEATAARAVLRNWGVKGDDRKLNNLIDRVHGHALTVDVLGSYLSTFHGGDPSKAPRFDPVFLADTDPKTAKLVSILTSYAEKLSARERDLIARLSIFPRGISVDNLQNIANRGSEVGGSLSGCDDDDLRKLLQRLVQLGLVFRYETAVDGMFSAHPFLRTHFSKLLGKHPTEFHAALRDIFAQGLHEQPRSKPQEPKELDRYERLIEITRLAGWLPRAFALYNNALGGYQRIIDLGESSRGLRIVSSFSETGNPRDIPIFRGIEILLRDWGIYSEVLGDLYTARRINELLAGLNGESNKLRKAIECWLALARISQLSGAWPESRRAATTALEIAPRSKTEFYRARAHSYLGTAAVATGSLEDAVWEFDAAEQLETEPQLVGRAGLVQAETRLQQGQSMAAAKQTETNIVFLENSKIGHSDLVARCHALLGRCVLPANISKAREHLDKAYEYTNKVGSVEIELRCRHLAAEIARYEKNYPAAISEAIEGIQLADSHKFGRWSVDLRLELAQSFVSSNQESGALEPANWVIENSRRPESQYIWGVADGLHLLGMALAKHNRGSQRESARTFLVQAIEIRKKLQHPKLEETLSAFDKIR